MNTKKDNYIFPIFVNEVKFGESIDETIARHRERLRTHIPNPKINFVQLPFRNNVKVKVTEVTSDAHLYVQPLSCKTDLSVLLARLNQFVDDVEYHSVNKKDSKKWMYIKKVGVKDIVLLKCAQGQWRRAQVTKIKLSSMKQSSIEVFLIDYGKRGEIYDYQTRIMELPDELSQYPVQALKCRLMTQNLANCKPIDLLRFRDRVDSTVHFTAFKFSVDRGTHVIVLKDKKGSCITQIGELKTPVRLSPALHKADSTVEIANERVDMPDDVIKEE